MYLHIGVAKWYVAGYAAPKRCLSFLRSRRKWEEVYYVDWTYRNAFWVRYRESPDLGRAMKIALLCKIT